MKLRVGIYPGAFDPIHRGHIAFATAAMQMCQLDTVVFLPEHKPRDKHNVTDISHRIALIKLATSPLGPFEVLKLASDQFTVRETLPEIQAKFAGADLTFLIGSDVVKTFRYRWEGLDTLFREVSFAVGMRANDDPKEVTEIMTEMEQTYAVKLHYTYVQTLASHF